VTKEFEVIFSTFKEDEVIFVEFKEVKERDAKVELTALKFVVNREVDVIFVVFKFDIERLPNVRFVVVILDATILETEILEAFKSPPTYNFLEIETPPKAVNEPPDPNPIESEEFVNVIEFVLRGIKLFIFID
jgi:hypothetical protein